MRELDAATKRLIVSARRRGLPLLRRVRPDRYTDADPFKLVMVPTEWLTLMQGRWRGALALPWLDAGPFARWSSYRRRWHAGRVLNGDWDQATQPLDDYHLASVVHDRFVGGRDWVKIPYIKKALRKVARGERAWGNRCATTEAVMARCRYLDELHAALHREGYSTERRGDKLAFSHFLVNIGRNGELIRNNDGKHRIILARQIGLPRLPARVFIRHRNWQRIRDAISTGEAPELARRFADHPDLEDLFSGTGEDRHAEGGPSGLAMRKR